MCWSEFYKKAGEIIINNSLLLLRLLRFFNRFLFMWFVQTHAIFTVYSFLSINSLTFLDNLMNYSIAFGFSRLFMRLIPLHVLIIWWNARLRLVLGRLVLCLICLLSRLRLVFNRLLQFAVPNLLTCLGNFVIIWWISRLCLVVYV